MDLRPDEQKALELFRPRAAQHTDNLEDRFLIRWLRARELDLNKAEIMLKKCLEWRETEKIEKTLEYEAPPEIAKNIHWKMSGYDSEGRPIFVFPMGFYEIRNFIQTGQKHEVVQMCRKMLEQVSAAVEAKKGEGVTQFVVIMDSTGLTFWKIAHLETINTTLNYFKEFDAYYPELLYRCYIINAPRAFSYIFNIVKPFMSMRTLGKVNVYDSGPKWRNVLNQDLPPASLPIEYTQMGIAL